MRTASYMEREYTGDWGDESLKLQGKTDIQNERAEGKTEYGEGPSLIRLFPTLARGLCYGQNLQLHTCTF